LHLLNVEKKASLSHVCQHNKQAWVVVNNEIYLYDIDTLDFLGSWEAHKNQVDAIISVGDQFVWTASQNEITIWEAQGVEIKNVKTVELRSACSYLYFSPMENRVWLAEEDVILVWDPTKLVPLQEITPDPPSSLVCLLRSNISDSLLLLLDNGELESWTHEIVNIE